MFCYHHCSVDVVIVVEIVVFADICAIVVVTDISAVVIGVEVVIGIVVKEVIVVGDAINIKVVL